MALEGGGSAQFVQDSNDRTQAKVLSQLKGNNREREREKKRAFPLFPFSLSSPSLPSNTPFLSDAYAEGLEDVKIGWRFGGPELKVARSTTAAVL